MEVDFDKQIDTILRDLAKGKTLAESPPVSHLDADELSAFAENALPPKARLRTMEHLADCSNCRKILSIFVSLEPVAESETIHEEAKTIVAIPEIPWFRKMFAFPALSYAMGAMALVLVGMVGFLILQNAKQPAADVAMREPVEEKVKGPSGLDSEGDATAAPSYVANTVANTNAVAANTAAPAAPRITNSVANTSSPMTANSVSTEPAKPLATPAPMATPTTADAPVRDKTAENNREEKTLDKNDAGGMKKEAIKQPATETAASGGESEKRSDDSTNYSQRQIESVPTQNRNVQNNQVMMPDGNEIKRGSPPPPPASKKSAQVQTDGVTVDETSVSAKNKVETKSSASKDVGGKTFRSEKGVWIDSAYRGGNPTAVKRGSDEYKKLDSGLRSTADHLGGTVIIVWKGKNYRIQ